MGNDALQGYVVRLGVLSIPGRDDETVSAVRDLLRTTGLIMVDNEDAVAGHQRAWIEETLRRWCDEEELDLIVTIGGTLPAPGPSALNVTPDATQAVVERLLPGFSETMRAVAAEENLLALLDRSVCGIRGRTLILNLPAGVASAVLFLEAVVELIEPLLRCLQEEAAAPSLDDGFTPRVDENPPPSVPSRAGLDAEEFARFLARKRTNRDE